MPYIKQTTRKILNRNLTEVVEKAHLWSSGDLNYIITKIVLAWIRKSDLSYVDIATVTGVLKNVSDEFTRRVVVPYEEAKRVVNGDVY